MAETIAVVSALATVASTGLGLLQAQQQAGAARIQSQMAGIQARQQGLQGRSIEQQGQAAALDVREALLRTLSAQQARYAAAGVLSGEGTPLALADAVGAEADRQLDTLRVNTGLAAESARIGAANTGAQARLLADQSRFAALSGPLSALATGAEGYLRHQARQPGTPVAPRTED